MSYIDDDVIALEKRMRKVEKALVRADKLIQQLIKEKREQK